MPKIAKTDVLFVINPHAGTRTVHSITGELSEKGINYVITQNPDALQALLASALENFKVFVAVGGDGTVSFLGRLLMDYPDKHLAVLPTGSGNGFARELGFSKGIERLMAAILIGKTRQVDILDINGNSFINVSGIGLDAAIAHRFHRLGTRGLLFYIIASIQSFLGFKAFQAKISTENTEHLGRFMMIAIANTRQFGNDAFISPDSDPTDGRFEIVLVKPVPLWGSFRFVYQLFSGKLAHSKYTEFISCGSEASIETDFKEYHCDGDPLTGNGHYKISLYPNKLGFIDMNEEI